MTAQSFCYWLQGFFEINDADLDTTKRASVELSATQVQCIRRHLAMVFKHEIDPSMGDAPHQAALSAIHEGQQPPKPETPGSRPPKAYCPGHTILRC